MMHTCLDNLGLPCPMCNYTKHLRWMRRLHRILGNAEHNGHTTPYEPACSACFKKILEDRLTALYQSLEEEKAPVPAPKEWVDRDSLDLPW